jgi:hypothetical protein
MQPGAYPRVQPVVAVGNALHERAQTLPWPTSRVRGDLANGDLRNDAMGMANSGAASTTSATSTS